MPSKKFWEFVKSLNECAKTWKDETGKNCWSNWDTFETLTENVDDGDIIFDDMTDSTDKLEEKIKDHQEDHDFADHWINMNEMQRTDAETSILLRGRTHFHKILKMSEDDFKQFLLKNNSWHNFGHLCVAYCMVQDWDCDPECDCIFDKDAKLITEKPKENRNTSNS